MTANELATIITTIVTAINTLVIAYLAFKKGKPEVKKLEIEGDSEIVGAANLNLEGAKISAQMLLDRINELKGELDQERQARKLESDEAETKRREDIEYFRRRIRDLERESRDYRSWAAKLVKQVVEAGKIPVPFVPSFGDSDISIQAVRTELEGDPEQK